MTDDDVTLREYLTQLIDAYQAEARMGQKNLERVFEVQLKADRDKADRTFDAIDDRFDNVNEFRGSLSDLSAKMATQDALRAMSDKAEASDAALTARFEGLYQRNRDDIDKLQGRMNLREGADAGARLTKGALYTATGAAVAIIGLLVVLANLLTSS